MDETAEEKHSVDATTAGSEITEVDMSTSTALMPHDDEDREELIKALSCSVCLELYECPKILQNCGHSLCKGCIENMLAKEPVQRRHTIACPQCCRKSPVVNGNANEMSTNFPIQQAVEAMKQKQILVYSPSCPTESQICDKLKSDISYLLDRRQLIAKEKLPLLLEGATKHVAEHVANVVEQIRASSQELESEIVKMLKAREEHLVKLAIDAGETQVLRFRKSADEANSFVTSLPPQLLKPSFLEKNTVNSLFMLYDKLVFEDEKLSSIVQDIEKETMGGRLLLFHDNNDIIEAIDDAILTTSCSTIVKWAGQLSFDEAASLIHISAGSGDLVTVQEICEQPPPHGTTWRDLIEHKDPADHSRTPLLQAAFFGQFSIVEYLLQKKNKANVWARDDKTGSLAVHLAALMGNLDIVQYLCDQTPEFVEAKDAFSSTPLYKASQNGQIYVVNYLVQEKHANLECRGYAGRTPLLVASGEGHLAVVEFLVGSGADITARDEENHMTALRLAMHFGHQDVVDFLESLGARKKLSSC